MTSSSQQVIKAMNADERVRLLSFADRWAYCVLQASGEIEPARQALEIGVPLDELAAVFGRLAAAGLVDARGRVVAIEGRAMSGAERVRRYRARRRVDVTNVTDVTPDVTKVTDDVTEVTAGVTDVTRSSPPCPHKEIRELYALHLAHWPPIRSWPAHRARALAARWREQPDLEWWDGFLAYCGRVKFLAGANDRGWRATIDWLLKPANFTKTQEGAYK